MTLEEQIKAYDEIRRRIHELEEEKKALITTILKQMSEKTMQIEGFVVRRYNYLSIKLSLEEARAINAVKMEEVVDKKKIKALYQLGNAIQGVSEVENLRVSYLKEAGGRQSKSSLLIGVAGEGLLEGKSSGKGTPSSGGSSGGKGGAPPAISHFPVL